MAKNARIKITAEDKTKRAIQSAKSNFEDLKGSAVALSGVIAGLAGAAGFGALIAKQVEYIRVSSRMADQIGVTTENFNRLAYAVDRTTEVSFEQFVDIMQEFNSKLGDAAVGGGTAVDALKQLGLSLDYIRSISPDQAFLEIADALNGMQDKARAAFLAEELFAGEAAKLAPLLQKGSKEILAQGEAFDKLGANFSAEEAAKVVNMQNKFKDLGTAIDGMGTKIAVFLSSEGTDLIGWLTKLTVNISNLPENLKTLFDFTTTNSQMDELNRKTEKYIQILNQGFRVNARGRREDLTEKDREGIRALLVNIDETREKLRALRDVSAENLAPINPVVTKGKSIELEQKDDFDVFEKAAEAAKANNEILLENAQYGADRFLEIWGGTFDTFTQGIGDAFASAIVDQESLGKGLQAVMREVAKSVISTLVQVAVQQATNMVLTKGMQAAATASMVGQLATIQAAATPAAIAANVATGGGAGVAAAASMSMAASALLGQFHDGVDYVPKTGSYLLEKGERVIPAKENKKQSMMTGPTVNFSINAIDTQSATQFLMQNEGPIIEMIQRAYDQRGASGGPTR